MNYNIISTGSQGNAVVLDGFVMIDCGVSFKVLKEIYKGLQLVLFTHCHTDHFKKETVKRLASERPTLRFAGGCWMVSFLVDCGVEKRNIDVLEPGNVYNYGSFKVSSFLLVHDVPNCGYRIFMGDKKVLYATDTGSMEGISAPGYDLYLLEANYTMEEMRERIKQKEAIREYPYEYDVIGRHLSKEACDEFIYANIGATGQYAYLHQHTEKRRLAPHESDLQEPANQF